MSEEYPSPFPTGLIPDTSFLRTLGGTDSDAYQAFIEYVRTGNRDFARCPIVSDLCVNSRIRTLSIRLPYFYSP